MNKQELVEDLSERCDLTKAAAGRAVDSILDSISDALSEREEVNLPGFGKFVTHERKARDAADPSDRSRTVHVPAATVPKFRPGTTLRAAVADVEAVQKPRPRPPARVSAPGEWKALSERG